MDRVMDRSNLKWQDIENLTQDLARQITLDNWRPDYIVGITRGGLIPANLLSQYFDVPMETLKVSFRDVNTKPESNLWMAEDAFNGKNILIVDDINDSGATLNWIKEDWRSGCLPDHADWDNVWGNNVRVAVLFDNEVSKCTLPITYSAWDINKANDPTWIIFPWEEWWKK